MNTQERPMENLTPFIFMDDRAVDGVTFEVPRGKTVGVVEVRLRVCYKSFDHAISGSSHRSNCGW